MKMKVKGKAKMKAPMAGVGWGAAGGAGGPGLSGGPEKGFAFFGTRKHFIVLVASVPFAGPFPSRPLPEPLFAPPPLI